MPDFRMEDQGLSARSEIVIRHAKAKIIPNTEMREFKGHLTVQSQISPLLTQVKAS